VANLIISLLENILREVEWRTPRRVPGAEAAPASTKVHPPALLFVGLQPPPLGSES
jgi:hypothetical protein